MKVSLNWLKELVDFNLTPQKLADQLSLKSIGVKTVTDDYIELDLTYNRGDLLSLRGVAREVAAITDSVITFVIPKISEYPWVKNNLPKTPVIIEDEKLCPVYCVAKIENLKAKSSPQEWVKKLNDCGIRSIDTITDITNLIMLEYGQTIHAFDAAKVADETMLVRLAKKGEQFVTLDGKNRMLTEEDLLITDPKGILSLSGVMGGKDSEITESTHTILLEVAIFDPVSIRRSSQRFGLHSEASKRIQHGLTKTNLLQALSAAIKMYEGLGGKLTAISLNGDLEDKPKIIQLTQEKVNSLIGTNILPEVVESSLQNLGFHPKGPPASQALRAGAGSNSWQITVPYWRLDINIEEDLIEEVARIYGYEKIKGQSLLDDSPIQLDQTLADFIYNLKLKLKEIGLTEIQSYSFYSTAVLEALETATEQKNQLIRVANPISSETEYLRKNLWPNLLEVVGKNIRKGFKDIAIFEIGKAYFKSPDGKVEEIYRLSIALMNNTDNPLAELYQLFQNSKLHLEGVKLNPANPPKEVSNLFHPRRFMNIEKNGKMIAGIAEVHLRVLNKLGIEKRVAVLEIDLQSISTVDTLNLSPA